MSPACPPEIEICGSAEGAAGAPGEGRVPVDKGNLEAGDAGGGSGRLGQSPVPGGFPGLLVGLLLGVRRDRVAEARASPQRLLQRSN